ncbi:ABC transporter substrate-binding protein [Ideonella livida]|uniref:ABC transporter substrate-binding protein n=1 Tax=Ideonella livida TaxID=2707176 RepID=A0A7C9TN26_9BURK|nr:ABC transporter substrate-binding protein [Ideonella livida]NDY93443.1 ABC transporter substrate-binding protein [Ideonella livida]
MSLWPQQSRAAAMAAALVWLAGVAPPVTALAQDAGVIRVGAVSSLTGPAAFPESTAAVRAYFDAVNASGGVRGRRLELVVADDQGDPATARAAAQRLLEDPRTVALVGSASTVDCTHNAAAYQAAGLMALQGTGVEPACFASAHIVPVNTGPYLSLRNSLQYAHEVLRARRLCAFVMDLPGMGPAYRATAQAWQKEAGVTLAHLGLFNPTGDVKVLVAQAEEKQCDAVVHGGVEPLVLAWARAVQAHPRLGKVPTVFLTPAYTERVAAELAAGTAPVYCMAEFEPWSSRSPTLSDWRAVMRRGQVPLSSFSQGGYTAAQLFVRTLRAMDGEISRANVARALQAVKEVELSMLGTRFTVGAGGSGHNPNRATLPMKLAQGQWRIASPFWVVAP